MESISLTAPPQPCRSCQTYLSRVGRSQTQTSSNNYRPKTPTASTLSFRLLLPRPLPPSSLPSPLLLCRPILPPAHHPLVPPDCPRRVPPRSPLLSSLCHLLPLLLSLCGRILSMCLPRLFSLRLWPSCCSRTSVLTTIKRWAAVWNGLCCCRTRSPRLSLIMFRWR
jgi:hypothetical protein